MALLRPPSSTTFRTVLGIRSAPYLRGIQQRRWARVHDVRFVATHHEPNRILDKYREKLDRKAKEEGLSNVDELKQAYKDKIEKLRKSASVPGATAPLPSNATPPSASASASSTLSTPSSTKSTQSPFPSPPPPPQPQTQQATTPKSSPSTSKPPPGVKTLSSYLDVAKTLDLPPKEIELLWRLRHANTPTSLCAVIPAETYARIALTARKHPQFILPIPREIIPEDSSPSSSSTSTTPSPPPAKAGGAELHFLQWTFPSPTTSTVLFTHLADYKLRGEFATPHTTLTHHLELAGPKGLVLAQGTVLENRGVSVDDGKWLIMCLQKFYAEQQAHGSQKQAQTQTGSGSGRRKLLEAFSRGDGDAFKVEELLEEAEKF
ncbi:MAG: hypothetical protein M1819_002960 [Sarea resinae]|nr:MAG: hypothetical protein M1819_002960 [Sarea resinae]